MVKSIRTGGERDWDRRGVEEVRSVARRDGPASACPVLATWSTADTEADGRAPSGLLTV